MTFEEFTNTTDREFRDISSETVRQYELIRRDKVITINDPIAISTSSRNIDYSDRWNYDRHLVVNSEGSAYRIPFMPHVDLLTWNTDPESEQVVL